MGGGNVCALVIIPRQLLLEALSALRSILVQKYFVGEEVKTGVPFNRGGLSLSSDPAICHSDIVTPLHLF